MATLEYWFTKTKSFKLMDTAQSETQQPILVIPAKSFKQLLQHDESRTELLQLLVQMRNRLLFASGTFVHFTNNTSIGNTWWPGGEATTVC